MDNSDALWFLILVIAVVLTAFLFSAAAALMAVDRLKLRPQAEDGGPRSRNFSRAAWLLRPIIFLLSRLSGLFLRLLGMDPKDYRETLGEHALLTYAESAHEDGGASLEEKQLISNVFDLGDSKACDIMVPRAAMVSLDADASYEEVLNVFRQEKFTRLPVYENNIDNVIGVVNIKDLLFTHQPVFQLRTLMRAPYFTYEYKNTSDLLAEMRQASINFTIVLDEYGATAGLITLEDILEEIVGDIRDEYDKDEENQIQRLSARQYMVEGSMKLDDINDALDLHLSSEEHGSLGGLMIEALDRLPARGETVTLPDGTRLTAASVVKNRIGRIRLQLPPLPEKQ